MPRRIASFSPVIGRSPRVLILGSMPGAASLAAGRYYAHPANSFWKLMGVLFGAGPELPYARRCALLRAGGVALWDVLASCVREGSLDSEIDDGSLVPNDVGALLRRHRTIRGVFLNGGKAAACYRRLIVPTMGRREAEIPAVRLPSTSPAHASRSFEQKLHEWRAVLAARDESLRRAGLE